MIIAKKSQWSGELHERDIPITEQQYHDWQTSGTFVQDAFPLLSPDDREFLISGVTPEEWAAAFPPEDEYDDEYDEI